MAKRALEKKSRKEGRSWIKEWSQHSYCLRWLTCSWGRQQSRWNIHLERRSTRSFCHLPDPHRNDCLVPEGTKKQIKRAIYKNKSVLNVCKIYWHIKSATNLQSLENDPRLSRGSSVCVFDLLPDGLQQPGVVSGRCDGLSTYVLHRAESSCPQTQIMKTFLE